MWSIFCTIKRSWSQHFVEQFSAFIILTMSYAAVLFVALALTNVQNLFQMWGEVSQVTVYLESNIKDQQKNEVVEALKQEPMVAAVKEVSSQESAKNFEERFAKVASQSIDSKQISQFFPSYLVIDLDHDKAYKSGLGTLDQFVFSLKSDFDVIRNVSYGKSWLNRYVGILAAIQWVGWFLILSFLAAAVIVSSSVIKTILFSRRDEIEILEFIGADDSTIYLPQIINTTLLSVTAFLSALAGVFLLFSQIKGTETNLVSMAIQEQLSFISPWILAIIATLAFVSVSLYSIMTVFNLLPRRKKALLIKEVIS